MGNWGYKDQFRPPRDGSVRDLLATLHNIASTSRNGGAKQQAALHALRRYMVFVHEADIDPRHVKQVLPVAEELIFDDSMWHHVE